MTKELRLAKVLQQLQILADSELPDNEIDDNLPEENGDVSDYEVFEDQGS